MARMIAKLLFVLSWVILTTILGFIGSFLGGSFLSAGLFCHLFRIAPETAEPLMAAGSVLFFGGICLLYCRGWFDRIIP
ncbi:MAG: hypothetical protein V1926_05840 [Candidatus Peregrinibacteria bacterium]